MTTDLLKEHLISEHKKDRNLTLIAFILVALIGGTVVYFLYTTIFNTVINDSLENSQGFPIALLVYIVFPLIGIGYVIYRILLINNRLGKIDLLLSKIEEGQIATSIAEETVYKFTIPLLKINFKLKPIHYMRIRFSGDKLRGVFLPVPIPIVTDLKALLSGASLQEMKEAWYELYASSATDKTTEVVSIKSEQAFNQFVKTDLMSGLTSLEKDRKSSYKKQIILTIVFSVLGISAWLFIQYFLPKTDISLDSIGDLGISPTYIIIGILIIYGIFTTVTRFKGSQDSNSGNEISHQFKIKIFNRIIHFIHPKFRYIIHGHIGFGELMDMGILERKNYTFQGNDQIMGNYNNVPFQICDLTLTYKPNFSEENQEPDVVFMGQVFCAKFNKKLNHELFIVPKKSKNIFKKKPVINDYLNNLGDTIILEDPEFMDLYDVYCNDQIEARYVLSPALMERIKKLDTLGSNLYLSFKDDRISILNNNGRNNFETGISNSLTADGSMLLFYQQLTEQLSIIDQLKLNVKIWK